MAKSLKGLPGLANMYSKIYNLRNVLLLALPVMAPIQLE